MKLSPYSRISFVSSQHELLTKYLTIPHSGHRVGEGCQYSLKTGKCRSIRLESVMVGKCPM
jgi:hypothetical protein